MGAWNDLSIFGSLFTFRYFKAESTPQNSAEFSYYLPHTAPPVPLMYAGELQPTEARGNALLKQNTCRGPNTPGIEAVRDRHETESSKTNNKNSSQNIDQMCNMIYL